MASIRDLKVGDKGDFRFHGSSYTGNEGYELNDLTVLKVERDRITLAEDERDTTGFDIYFMDNRWRYGSSAEVITLIQKNN